MTEHEVSKKADRDIAAMDEVLRLLISEYGTEAVFQTLVHLINEEEINDLLS